MPGSAAWGTPGHGSRILYSWVLYARTLHKNSTMGGARKKIYKTQRKCEIVLHMNKKKLPKEKTEKHTFEVPVEDLWIFFVKAREKRLKVKEAIAEAIRDWNTK